MPLTEYFAHFRSGGGGELTDGEAIDKHGPQSIIPVPLFPGETEEKHEQAFVASLAEHQRKYDDQSTYMRNVRLLFARMRVNWFGKDEGDAPIAVKVEDLENKVAEYLPRAALCAVKFVERWLYQQQVGKKFFHNLKTTPPSTIYQWYGTSIPPVYMPLHRWETHEECEGRYQWWLRDTKNMEPDNLLRAKSPSEERRLRIEFAATAIDEKKGNGAIIDGDTMWERRVLALTEYLTEGKSRPKRSSNKRRKKCRSEYQPIPVPLFEGETEEQYEQSFLATLPHYRRSQYHLSAPPIHIRHLLIFFANARAQWFARSKSGIELSVDDVNNRCLKDLSQAGLCVV